MGKKLWSPYFVHCSREGCTKLVLITKTKEAAKPVHYCSHTCADATRVRAAWPSPAVMSKWVLERPTVYIAKDLGVSDVAVKKFCKKYGIRHRGRGYFQKLMAGASYAEVEEATRRKRIRLQHIHEAAQRRKKARAAADTK